MSPTGDVERDQVLTQRIRLFAWIKPVHLDLPIADPSLLSPSPSRSASPPVSLDLLAKKAEVQGEKGEENEKAKQQQTQGFLLFARRELLKINQYKAPRDKLICVLNSCKVIFGRPHIFVESASWCAD
jgi:hypothetical protein